jgi:hypothetical protein
MKKAICIFAFVALTFFIGGTIANIYLEWPAPMPDWLFDTTMFALRVIGVGEENNTDDAEVTATLIIACISWALTGFVLWLLLVTVRRLWNRRKT